MDIANFQFKYLQLCNALCTVRFYDEATKLQATKESKQLEEAWDWDRLAACIDNLCLNQMVASLFKIHRSCSASAFPTLLVTSPVSGVGLQAGGAAFYEFLDTRSGGSQKGRCSSGAPRIAPVCTPCEFCWIED